MRPRSPHALLALLAVTAVAAAGCLAPAAEPASAADAGAAASPPPAGTLPDDAAPVGEDASGATLYARTVSVDGTLEAGTVGGWTCVNGQCVNVVSVDVDPEASVTGLVAELRWDGPLDLDLFVIPRGGAQSLNQNGLQPATRESWSDTEGLPGQPDSVARVEVLDEAEFEEPVPWTVNVRSKAAVNVAFELRVTLFYGGQAPSGWSYFDQG